MLANPRLGWQKLQDVYYCLRPCYETLNWSIENIYSNYRIAISTNTTLIALASKFVPYPNVIDIYSLSGNKIWSVIFNSTAIEHIVDYVFKNEELCVVLNSQKFRYYQDFKGNFTEHSYTKDLVFLDDTSINNPLNEQNGKVNSDNGGDFAPQLQFIIDLENNQKEEVFQIDEVKIWGNFLVLKLTNRFIITNLDTFTNYQIPFASSLFSKMHCINPLNFNDDFLSILVSFDKTIILINIDFSMSNYEIIDHGLTEGPFAQLTASPNGQLIALFNSQVERIFVISNKFDQVLLEYDTSNDSSSPYQVEWCGNDAIVLSLKDELKLIGPGQNSISFFYDIIDEEEFDLDSFSKNNDQDEFSFTIPVFKTEPDGLKIITKKKVEFLSRVPEVSINLHQIGSSHPSSLLLDCIDKLSQHSSKSDTNISLLKSDDSLLLAINDCLKASLNEFNQSWQKKLLKAVSFGKTYYDDFYNADEYLKTLNYLKVLNQLASPEFGIFLTYNQLINIGWKELIQMLLRRDLHLLALKMIDLLELQNLKELVYIHWCCYKIRKELNMSDTELFEIISKKLTSAIGPSKNSRNYVTVDKISDVAYEEGRINLCKLLINFSPSVVKKINQFLKFGEFELALIKSFQSGDYDLCRLLLLHLHDVLSVSQFFKILNQNEQKGLITDTSVKESKNETPSNECLFISGDLIGNFWVESIGKFDKSSLKRFYKQEDKISDLRLIELKSFITKSSTDETESESYYDTYKLKLSKLTGRTTNKKSTKIYQREIEILELKKRLSETYQVNFFREKSVNSILVKLIEMNQLKPASKVVKELKISQEKFWYLVLDVYAKNNSFDKIYQFVSHKSDSKSDRTVLKSPIGFKPFVEALMAYKGPKDQISIYINNCSDIHYTEKVDMYIQNEDLILAANEAFKYKDINLLKEIKERAIKLGNGHENILNVVKSYITRLGY